MPAEPVKPITPDEAAARRLAAFPNFVIEAFNACIARNYRGGVASVPQEEVIVEILLRQQPADPEKARNQIFTQGWLDIEPLYRAQGWEVRFNRPAYNETFSACFYFSKAQP